MSAPGIPQATSGTAEVDVLDTAACPACPHPLETHDAIDLRFCRATTAGARSRGCTCAAR